jgi:hypothetical protein
MTMLDAHEMLMEQVRELPFWLKSMGHRRHRIHLLTYSGCPKGRDVGQGDARLVSETGTSLDQGISSGRPDRMAGVVDAIQVDSNVSGTETCGRRFEGAELHGLLRDLLKMATGDYRLGTGERRERGRIALVVHDGRNVSEDAALSNPEIDRMTETFDQVILLQPDIAPLVWAAQVYRSSGPAVRMAKEVFVDRVKKDLYKDCVALRGAAACKTPKERRKRTNAARQVVETVSPRTLTGTIHHRQFVTRSSLVTLMSGSARIGSAKYVGRAREIDRVFRRPTGMDALGCRLAELNKGGLELLGGYPGQELSCGATGSAETDRPGMARIIERHSPFAHAYTVEVCVDEEGEALTGRTSFRLELDGRTCVEGERDFSRQVGTPSSRLSASAMVASVCAEELPPPSCEDCPKETTIDYRWTGLAAILGLGIGIILRRRR